MTSGGVFHPRLEQIHVTRRAKYIPELSSSLLPAELISAAGFPGKVLFILVLPVFLNSVGSGITWNRPTRPGNSRFSGADSFNSRV